MDTPLTQNIRRDREALDLAAYEKAGGYQAMRKALRDLGPKGVADEVDAAKLRGRGGAGFPTAKKWSFMPSGEGAPMRRYLVANADEMEPGTFKDRLLLEGDPNQMVEAMIVSAFAIGASTGFVFLRGEYTLAEQRLQRAIDEARAKGYLGRNILGADFNFDLHLHTSAGRYLCGEETALLNALEGRRATPRQKPPHPQVSGLWGRPTVVNNVETLCNVPHIVTGGAAWYRGLALTEGGGGTKLYGASGRVNKPGCWELPLGTPLRELIEVHAGGMREGYTFRACLPGGASTALLTAEHLDVAMDFDAVGGVGSRLGTGCVTVIDDSICIVALMQNLEHFFAQESCGWCTPCREGLPWTERLLIAIEAGKGRSRDLEVLDMHCDRLGMGKTFCAHAPGAMMPLESALKLFRADFERHIEEGCCPWQKTPAPAAV